MRSGLGLLAVVVVLVVGGCLAPGGQADPDSVSDRVDQRLESIETLQTTLVWEMTVDGQRSSFSADIAYEKPNLINLTYRSPEALAGVSIVGNGSKLVVYNPDNDRYTVRNVTSNGTGAAGVFLGLTAVENASFEGNETLAGEDALELSYAVQGSKLSLLLAGGTSTTSLSDTDDDAVDVTVWIDRDQWVPRKATLNYSAFRKGMNSTVTYEDTTIGESLPTGTFDAGVSPDASQVESMLETMLPENATGYASYEEMARTGPVGLPPESLPGNITYQQGYSLGGANGSYYQLMYSNETTGIQIQFFTEPVGVLQSPTTRMVDGQTVQIARVQEATMMEWRCQNRTYLVTAPTDAVTVESIVGTIGCN